MNCGVGAFLHAERREAAELLPGGDPPPDLSIPLFKENRIELINIGS